MNKQTLIIAIAFLFSIQTKAQNNIPPKSTIVVQPNAQKKYTIIGAYEINSNVPPKSAITEQPNAKTIFLITDLKIADSITIYNTDGTYFRKHRIRATITSNGVGVVKCQWVEKVYDGLGHLMYDGPITSEFSVKINGTGIDFTDIIFEEVGFTSPSLKALIIKSPINLKSNELTN